MRTTESEGRYMQEQMQSVSRADIDARVSFIRKTYTHLFGAIIAFVAVCAVIFATGLAETITPLLAGSAFSWILVLIAFTAVGRIANKWAMSDRGTGMQYAGLGLFIVAEAIIFTPLLYFAASKTDEPMLIPSAGLITLVVFAGLTVSVFMTKKDFSFMRSGLAIATAIAFGVIGFSLIFGFSLGVLFAAAMVLLASGYILYYTSNVLHHYNTNQHVAAALALFSSVALLFYYVLAIMGRD